MSSSPSRGTMLMDGLPSTIVGTVLASAGMGQSQPTKPNQGHASYPLFPPEKMAKLLMGDPFMSLLVNTKNRPVSSFTIPDGVPMARVRKIVARQQQSIVVLFNCQMFRCDPNGSILHPAFQRRLFALQNP